MQDDIYGGELLSLIMQFFDWYPVIFVKKAGDAGITVQYNADFCNKIKHCC